MNYSKSTLIVNQSFCYTAVMIRNIIFDFGGVILKHPASVTENIIAKIFSISPEEAATIWKREKASLMKGQISSEQFIEKIKNELHFDSSTSELLKLWSELYVKEAQGINADVLSLVDTLKQTYKVYLFTDTIDVHDAYNSTRNIYEKFTKVFKSYEEGVAKTEGEKAFIYLFKKIQAKPEECVLIDDLEENIQRAQACGIKGILYKNFDDLQQQLAQVLS